MNITGIVVRTRPEALSRVREALGTLAGVEVHGVGENGRVVVTVEDVDGSSSAPTVLAVQNVEGVLSATLAYNYFDRHDDQKEGEYGTVEA